MEAIDKVFLINLEKRKDRYEEFRQKYVSLFGNKFVRVNAIDGKTYRYSLDEIKLMSKADWNIFTKPGVQGCFLSHLFILNYIVNNNLKTCMILEDDVKFSDPQNLNSDLKNIMEHTPKDWEIIFTGSSIFGHEIIGRATDFVGRINKNHCTHCYLINLEGAKNILKQIYSKGMYRAIDCFYNDYLVERNIFYASVKSLATQNQNFESDIDTGIYGFKI